MTNLTNRLASTLILGALTVAMVGCEKSAEQRAQDVQEARNEANEESAEAIREANEKTAEARHEAREEITEAQRKANDAEREAQVKAAEASREANEKIAKEENKVDSHIRGSLKDVESARANLKKDLLDDLTGIDKRIVELRQKVNTKSDVKAPRQELLRSADEIKSQADGLRRQVNDVSAPSETAVDSAKRTLETRVSQLSKSLDALEDRI